MRVGGAEGYNEVYEFVEELNEESGTTIIAAIPMLDQDEKIVARFPGTVFRIRGGYASAFDRGVGGYLDISGKAYGFDPWTQSGTLFVTNQRIVFIRRKWGWKDGYINSRKPLIHGVVPDGETSRKLRCGGIEFFEIPFEDVKGHRSTLLGGYIWIKTDKTRYRLHLGRKELACIVHLTEGQAKDAQSR